MKTLLPPDHGSMKQISDPHRRPFARDARVTGAIGSSICGIAVIVVKISGVMIADAPA